MNKYVNLFLLTVSLLVVSDAQLAAGKQCTVGSQCSSGSCKRGSALPQTAGATTGQCCSDKGKGIGCLACFSSDGSCIICGPGYELKDYACVKCGSSTPLSYPVKTWSAGDTGDAATLGCYAKTSSMSIVAGDGCESGDPSTVGGKTCASNYCQISKNGANRNNECPPACTLTQPSSVASGSVANTFPNSCNTNGNILTTNGKNSDGSPAFLCKKSSNGDAAFKCACCRPLGKDAGASCTNSFECHGGDCRGGKCCAPEDLNGAFMTKCKASDSGTGMSTTTTTTTGTTSSSGTGSGSGGSGSGTGMSTTTTTTTSSSSGSSTTGTDSSAACSRRASAFTNGGGSANPKDRFLEEESDKGLGCCTAKDCGDCMCSCQSLNGGGVQTSQTIKSTKDFCTSDGCTKRLGEGACPSKNSQRSAMFTKSKASVGMPAKIICAATLGLVGVAAAATAIHGM